MEMQRPAGWRFQPETVAGKGAIVSGGTTGIGRATATLLASQGARVLIFGRHETELGEALEQIRAAAGNGGEAHGLTADQSRTEELERVFQEADRALGAIDILVNNAAVPGGSIAEADRDKPEYVVQTNLVGYLTCTRLALERMRPRKSGHIVHIGSMSADLREEGNSVYVATKAGIQGFSESLRKEVNPDGIKVTLIEPGLVQSSIADRTQEEEREKIEKGEMLTAEEIAETVLFALIQPRRCDIVTAQVRPHLQLI